MKAFEAVLAQWFQARGLKAGEGIAIDGKTLRGIHGEKVPGVHLGSAYAHGRGIVLDEEAAPGEGRESCKRSARKRREGMDISSRSASAPQDRATSTTSPAWGARGALTGGTGRPPATDKDMRSYSKYP